MLMQLDLGDVTIEWVGAERFWLDAGAMFGPVPKLLWEGRYPVGVDNLSPYVATPILVRTGGQNVLIDTGLGNRLTPRQLRNFRVEYAQTVPEGLRILGIEPSAIDTVILTHLDWDHAAGIIEQSEVGEKLRYPRAVHVIGRVEWEDAIRPNLRSKNTYSDRNWWLLDPTKQIRWVEGGEEVAPGVRLHHTGGHTRGHLIVEIRGTRRAAYHLADLLPTHAHLNPLWVTAYDNFPLDSVEQKERWLKQAAADDAWLLFYHDDVYAAIRPDGEGRMVEGLRRPWASDLGGSQP